MPNIIQIKRSTGNTNPAANILKRGELAYVEGNGTDTEGRLFIGVRESAGNAAVALAIGGPGSYLTRDTNQNVSGTKTFSTTSLKITGAASNGQVLSASTDGTISFSNVSANAFSTITDGSVNAVANGADTFKLRAGTGISVAVQSNDATHGDNAIISLTGAGPGTIGGVKLQTTVDTATDATVSSSGIKTYVDSRFSEAVSGLDIKASVRAATTYKLQGGIATYNNSTKVLTSATNININDSFIPEEGGVASAGLDGVSLQVNDRILVKNQDNAAHNGIYRVTSIGSGSTPFTLQRADDADSDTEVNPGIFVFVEEGSINEDTGWVLTTDSPITLGTTPLTFTQFAGPGSISAGTGLTRSGNQISLITPVSGANGGTGQTSYAAGDLLYANSGSTLARLAAAATGNVLLSGTTPSWGKVGLTSHITGTLAVVNGGTGATTADAALTNLGANTVGASIFKLANPTQITFLRINANNTVTARTASDFRGDIGAGTGNGTVTSVTGSGGITVTNGSTTPAVSLTAAYGDTTNPYGTKAKNFVLAGPTADPSAAPTFRALVEADLPNISASKITSGILSVDRGGTGATTIAGILKGNGTSAFTAANPGTDYVAPNVRGKVSFVVANNTAGTQTASIKIPPTGSAIENIDNAEVGDIWNSAGVLKLRTGSSTRTILDDDATINGGTF
jgi:hypothetical protein